MPYIRDIITRVDLLDRKTKIYKSLTGRLNLLIDQAMPDQDLPPGTTSDDALLVRDELNAIIANMDEEREGYLAIEADGVEVPEADSMVLRLVGAGSDQD